MSIRPDSYPVLRYSTNKIDCIDLKVARFDNIVNWPLEVHPVDLFPILPSLEYGTQLGMDC